MDCVGESQGHSSLLSLIPLHVYSHLHDSIHFPTSNEASSNVFNIFAYLLSSFKQPMSQPNRLSSKSRSQNYLCTDYLTFCYYHISSSRKLTSPIHHLWYRFELLSYQTTGYVWTQHSGDRRKKSKRSDQF